MEKGNLEVKTTNKRAKNVKIISILVLIIAILAGGTYIGKTLFFSTPNSTIRGFYAAISNNQMKRCIDYTDIQDRLDAQVPNKEERATVLNTFEKQFNISERTIHIKLISVKKVEQDDQAAIYDIKYDTNIKYKNGSDYQSTQSDKIYLTKIRGQWKIVDGSGMYAALTQIMNGVVEGQNSLLQGIK